MDLYRFENQEDAFNKGIFEAIDEHDFICIEWPKREENYSDASWVRLQFSFTPQ
jgi:tRNA A37 threonylcarbamoyladenosine biosynthesis protein TsaE